eukprot:COSAG01_NODE_2381_length_7792_cov_5.907578_6_plen_164_part_00
MRGRWWRRPRRCRSVRRWQGQPARAGPRPQQVRVRVKIMGLIIIRTDGDFPTILHFCDPVISTRTRSRAASNAAAVAAGGSSTAVAGTAGLPGVVAGAGRAAPRPVSEQMMAWLCNPLAVAHRVNHPPPGAVRTRSTDNRPAARGRCAHTHARAHARTHARSC